VSTPQPDPESQPETDVLEPDPVAPPRPEEGVADDIREVDPATPQD
jgi:hypothetical protein